MSNPEESPHTTAVRRQDKLNRLATERLRVANGKVEKYKAAPPVQDIEKVIVAERLANMEIGDLVPGKGIFFGTYMLKNERGNLRKVFNMFAAPENLTDEAGEETYLSYKKTIRRVADLRKWHDHDGASYANHTEIFKALEEGTYQGGWVVPPREFVNGTDDDFNEVQTDNILAHKDKGMFQADKSPGEYWASTTNGNSFQIVSKTSVGHAHYTYPHEARCRPVRFELVP